MGMVERMVEPMSFKLKDGIPNFLFDNALVWLDDSGIKSAAGLITSWDNRGTGGPGFDLDVILGTAANLKPHDSGSALFYGASGDFISTPDSVAASITGDIQLDYTFTAGSFPAAFRFLGGKWESVGQLSYRLLLNSGNFPEFRWTEDGTAQIIRTSTVVYPVVVNIEGTLTVTLDVSTGEVEFFVDGELLDTVAGAGATSIFNGTSEVSIGGDIGGTQNRFTGLAQSLKILNGIDGTLAVNFDARDGANKTGIANDTFVSSETGETYTMAGNTFIQNSGQTIVNSIGSAGLKTTMGQLINTPMTIFMVGKAHELTGLQQNFIGAESTPASEPFLAIRSGSNAFMFNAGATLALLTGDTDLHLHVVRYNADPITVYEVNGVGSVVGNAGSEPMDFGSVLASAGGGNSLIGSMSEYVILPFEATDAEVSAITNYLTDRHKGV